MHTLQHTMHRPIHLGHPLPGRIPPRQKHDPARARFRHGVDHLLREFLPAVVCVAVGFGRLDCQAGVEHEHAAVRPGGEQAAVLRRGLEVWIVVFQRDVHVFQRGWGSRWGAHGEGEPVRLVDAVVGVLADYDGFDGVEGGVLGPFWR